MAKPKAPEPEPEPVREPTPPPTQHVPICDEHEGTDSRTKCSHSEFRMKFFERTFVLESSKKAND